MIIWFREFSYITSGLIVFFRAIKMDQNMLLNPTTMVWDPSGLKKNNIFIVITRKLTLIPMIWSTELNP